MNLFLYRFSGRIYAPYIYRTKPTIIYEPRLNMSIRIASRIRQFASRWRWTCVNNDDETMYWQCTQLPPVPIWRSVLVDAEQQVLARTWERQRRLWDRQRRTAMSSRRRTTRSAHAPICWVILLIKLSCQATSEAALFMGCLFSIMRT